MIIEICIVAVSVSFIILTIFLVVGILNLRETLAQSRDDLDNLTEEGAQLINSLNEKELKMPTFRFWSHKQLLPKRKIISKDLLRK